MNLASDFNATLYPGGTQPPPPNMEPETQAKQMRAALARTPAKQPMAPMPYGHMMPYGPMGRVSPTVMGLPTSPPMMSMQHAAMMGMPPYMMGTNSFSYPQVVGPQGAGLQLPGKKMMPPSTYIRVSIFLLTICCKHFSDIIGLFEYKSVSEISDIGSG